MITGRLEHVGGLDNWLVKTSDTDLSLRARRLMLVLEQSATPAARDLLRKLSGQAAEPDLRAEAQASLVRLENHKN